VDKEEVKKFLNSEIFEEKVNSRFDSAFILKQIKASILINIDKPNIDVVDLFHWAVSNTFQTCLNGILEDLKEEAENSRKIGSIEIDGGLLS
jgi:hypothetical protein